MRITDGYDGWTQISGEGLNLPGTVYVRMTPVDGQRRVTEVYFDGRGEPIGGEAMRRFPLQRIETFLARWKGDRGYRFRGPDLSRLARSYATQWVSAFTGRRCGTCSGPLENGLETALTDWIALSWYAQYEDSGIEQAPLQDQGRRKLEPTPVLSAPAEGLTDAFLTDVARAYSAAVGQGQPPALTLAKLAGVKPKTVHSWVYKARQRGLMDPATRKGRIV
jgi:hypothetical protein